MKIHPREKQVREAERILRDATVELYELELTPWEQVRVLNRVLSDAVASVAKYSIRHDRHGDTETPGGLS